MPHGKHMFPTASDIDMKKMYAYPSLNYALPHRKWVLHCCAQFPWTDLPIA